MCMTTNKFIIHKVDDDKGKGEQDEGDEQDVTFINNLKINSTYYSPGYL